MTIRCGLGTDPYGSKRTVGRITSNPVVCRSRLRPAEVMETERFGQRGFAGLELTRLLVDERFGGRVGALFEDGPQREVVTES